MVHEPTAAHGEPDTDSARHMVHMLMQFALAVRARKNVVIIALVISFLLSGLYYATAKRLYMAKAGLVLQISPDTLSPGISPQPRLSQAMLPTYEGLISRSEVIKGAIERIPREHALDFVRWPKDEWVKVIQSKLSVSNLRKTNIVEVSFRSEDPQAAVTVVNAVVDSYQEFMDKTYKRNATRSLEALKKSKDEVAAKLEAKKQELAKARERVRNLGISTNSEVLHPAQQKVVTLHEKYEECDLRRRELAAALASIREAIQRGENLQQQVLVLAETLGQDVLISRLNLNTDDAGLRNELIQSHLEDQAKLAEMQRHLGWAHPAVRDLQARIQQTEQSLLGAQNRLKQELARIQDSELGPMLIELVQQKLDIAEQYEQSLAEELERAEAKAVGLVEQLAHLRDLEGDRDFLQEELDFVMKQMNDVDLKDEGQDVRVHRVDEPKVDNQPVSPRLARTFLVALAAGLGLGLSIVYVLDILDDRFRSMEEMQTLLGVPVLAMVRELQSSDEPGIGSLQTYGAPNATESEAFRTLRTSLSLAEDDTHQLVISSPEPGDGKTTVLANLAVAVAQSGKKTLLIDADLRRPGLTAMLGMRGIDGLSTVIRGEDDIVHTAKTHIRPSGLDGLDVLPSGPRPTNPAELLGSQRFSELLAWAESVYDQIFIDSPPTLATSDTAVIGRLTNAVVLVVQPAKNRRRMVMRCVESFAVLRIPLLGVVVNRIGTAKDGGYYGYGYGGYYGYEYAYRYGEDSDDGVDDPRLDVGAMAPCAASGPGEEEPRRPDEMSPSGGIVPRRVA
jgi:succinoglycan biosynthesis transport protein ExoP